MHVIGVFSFDVGGKPCEISTDIYDYTYRPVVDNLSPTFWEGRTYVAGDILTLKADELQQKIAALKRRLKWGLPPSIRKHIAWAKYKEVDDLVILVITDFDTTIEDFKAALLRFLKEKQITVNMNAQVAYARFPENSRIFKI